MKKSNPLKTLRAPALVTAVFTAATIMILPAHAELLVYEPFDYADGSTLTGQGGALGTTGTWTAFDTHNGDWYVHAEGTSADIVVAPGPVLNHFDGIVDNLPTLGGYVGLPGPADIGRGPDEDFEIGRNMDASIGLDPRVTASFQSGTTTWFSYLAVKGWDRNEETPNFMLCTDPTANESRAFQLTNSGNGIGTGGGPPRNNRTHIYPMYYSGGPAYTLLGTPATWQDDTKTVPEDGRMNWEENDRDGNFGAPNIVVGKIEWDADTGGEDVITVVRFLEDETIDEPAFDALVAAGPNRSSANWAANKPDLDQSQFDTLNIAGLKFFVDELRIATTFEEAIRGGSSAASKLQLNIGQVGDDLVISWDSQGGMLYNLRSVVDPSSAEPRDWPIYEGNVDIEATAPTNSITISRPADSSRYFVIEEFPAPPATVFSDDFENGQGTWTTGSDGNAGSEWELGTPSNAGPTTTNSGVNCFGTNLDGNYELSADVWLRSPDIDLTGASGATLTYAEFRDIEAMFDFGTVNVLDATDDSLLAELESDIDGQSTQWEIISQQLPAEALGKVIKIEFRFSSDDFTNQAGWYIDDMTVTTPAP